MRRSRKLLLVLLAVPVLLLVAAAAAWALDARASEGEVLRNVTLAGEDVGGRTEAEVRADVERLAERLASATVEVDAEGGGFSATLADLGASVDVDATVRDTMDVGRDGFLPGRAVGWLASLVAEREAPVRLEIDQAQLRGRVAALDQGRTPPVEPHLRVDGGRVVAVEGRPGEGIDDRDVAAGLEDAVTEGGDPVMLEVERGDVEPRFGLADAERLATRAEELASPGLSVKAGEGEAVVPAERIRGWMRAVAGTSGLELRLDPEAVQKDLAEAFPDAGTPARDATFTVEGGGVVIHPSAPGTSCCAEQASQLILDGLSKGTRPVEVPLQPLEPKLTTQQAEELRIVEPVGEGRTEHPAGQPRVQNIHRMADIVRGQVILPGQTFSINGFVGERTADKGFVNAPVIYNGKFEEDIGGGVSQFATTMFNAAFFGGLDIVEYQSHSIYISRYPYGREATLSYPKPDLVVKNTTPHGILLWPTYTESSITVQLWGTRFSPGEQTGQSVAQRGNCKRVTTERTRTYVEDGRTEVDYVYATYRPGEGVNC